MLARMLLLLVFALALPVAPVAGRQATPAIDAPEYEMTVLPDLGGVGVAVDINDRGEIVGWGTVPGIDASAAFYWPDAQTLEVLPTATGGSASAYAINDTGQIVGIAEDANGSSRPVTWVDGQMHDLGTLGGATGEAAGLNDAGQVVGWSETAGGAQHATLWDDGEIIDLAIPWGDASRAIAITAGGEIIGSAWFTDDPRRPERPFLWRAVEVNDLGDLDGGGGNAIAITDSGVVTGHARDPDAGMDEPMNGRAVLWVQGSMLGLEGLGERWSWGVDISDDLAIVGVAGGNHDVSHAFRWAGGEVTWLEDRGGASGATGVNTEGTIVGWWQENPGEFESQAAVVWVPAQRPVGDAESQMVCLPKGYRFAANKVCIRRDLATGDVILRLRPDDPLSPFKPHPPLDDIDAYLIKTDG